MFGYHLPIINRSEIPYKYIYIYIHTHTHTKAVDRGKWEWRVRSLSYIEKYYNVAFNYNGAEVNFMIQHVDFRNNILQNGQSQSYK